MKDSPLFRPEAMTEQQDRWLGSVLLLPRLPYTVAVVVVALLAGGLIALIAWGEYTRKVRLAGWLAPESGLLQVVAPQTGVLARVSVQEGQEVKSGEPLAVVSSERQSGAFATQQEVLRALQARRDSLNSERESHRALFARQQETQHARLDVLRDEIEGLDAEFALQRRRVARAEEVTDRQRDLRAQKLSTEDDLLRAEDAAFAQAQSLNELERARAAVNRSRVELESEMAEHPLRLQVQLAEIDRQIAQIEQDLAEAEAGREAVVLAPMDGTVTALRAATGDGVGSSAPLMTLIPSGARMQARLYGPSRDIGFVQPGQRVLVRYDAFPHQKFGRYEGTVSSVSRATINAGELGAASSGSLADLVRSGEPVYRITVDLDQDFAETYGRSAALQAGMTLEADIQIETRRLWQWLLDPLYSLHGGEKA
ncbi:HlyD family efflux transporter periplasmic adaptor subunit [Paracoccus sp. M683]|uniref:HlyD family secretion protein n=1 Tax=Paracoccus sp. M683 TaxID=2594268 RepID=UPI00117F67AE|nr:HlyD family efflux transporter periplasmic adaptor subunit [Paracoccus sp. M683]TRW91453.1 HlyD family efflux transporter periplasmic adaptor subunit [Paracoccus sp. M683]